MEISIIVIVGCLAIVWFGADKSGRREWPFPTSQGGYPMSGSQNPYMDRMWKLGLALAIPAAIVVGLIAAIFLPLHK